jgi:hypothetical protein
MKQILFNTLLLLVLAFGITQRSWGQGATTASMNGAVTDGKGEVLPGATVLAIHTPTGTQYGAGTNGEGRYNIQNLRVGGPYTIKVSFVGYQDFTKEGVFLTLGQTLRVDVQMSEASTALGDVVVTGRPDPVINAGRTGAETSISREQISNLPTLNRNLTDFTRLTPQAAGGGSSSFGGSNNRYNNITIDGAVNNDVFGLASSGTPGGQANTSPIALDAIEQIAVVLAPYDVTVGNFTGAGVNAVTRSGSNDVSASIYGFGRNQNSTGRSIGVERTKADNFYNYQTGFRVGGPIVKDKVFFFLSGEIQRVNTPLGYLPGSSESRADTSVIRRIRQASLRPTANGGLYGGYDPGTVGDITRLTESNKIFARLDFNLSENNTLTIRHNFIKAFDDNITRSAAAVRFSNNAYRFSNLQNSTVAELNSRFSGGFSNKLILNYTAIRDSRDVVGAAGPAYQISQGGITYNIGQDRSSVANQLDQDIVEITDNLTKAYGKHTLTLGTHSEGFKFRNLFLNNGAGYYTFSSIDNFVAGRATQVQASYASPGGNGEAKFKAAQLGFYLQDEYTPVENLRLTLGMRIDVPVFFDKPGYNAGVTDGGTIVSGVTQPGFGGEYRTSNTPNGQVLYSPRLGFNWDVKNNGKLQVRGGTGIFSGRVPFVWISNSFTNNGLIQGGVNQTAATGTFLPYIRLNPAQIATDYTATAQSQINLVRNDFKLPQVWRSNLALDFRLPGDVVGTVEGIYSKTLNDIYYKDLNLTAPVGNLVGPDNRPIYANSTQLRRVNQSYTNVYLLDNTSQGYRYNLTFQLQKRFLGGLNTTAAYTYGKSKEVNSGISSTASSNYAFNQIAYDPNTPELGYSRNDQRHRIIASTGYTLHYANDKLATTFSLFYEGLSGQPLTYIYGQNTDLNRDGNTGNDLLYVPTDARDVNQIRLVATEGRTLATVQNQLENFIQNDPYLSSHRGQIVERFGARLPWTHQIDIRVAQDIALTGKGKRNALQITFDVINAGNLLNKNWGRQYVVNNNALELLRVESTSNTAQPTFSLPSTYGNSGVPYDFATFASRWQGQLGVRYSFN